MGISGLFAQLYVQRVEQVLHGICIRNLHLESQRFDSENPKKVDTMVYTSCGLICSAFCATAYHNQLFPSTPTPDYTSGVAVTSLSNGAYISRIILRNALFFMRPQKSLTTRFHVPSSLCVSLVRALIIVLHPHPNIIFWCCGDDLGKYRIVLQLRLRALVPVDYISLTLQVGSLISVADTVLKQGQRSS